MYTVSSSVACKESVNGAKIVVPSRLQYKLWQEIYMTNDGHG